MMKVVLAGGGTAGHVNPLLAVADTLVRDGHTTPEGIRVIGTAEGLETRLVPAAGYQLSFVARLPLPRRLSLEALTFVPKFVGAVLTSVRVIRSHRADVVAGFGGYASAPVYVAAWLARVPLVIHEANAVAGFANRLGARLTTHVATTFRVTRLPHSNLIGMPLTRALTHPSNTVSAGDARKHFGLSPRKKTLVVTGGSQGSVRINSTLSAVIPTILESGWQVLHIVGGKNPLPDTDRAGYVVLTYCDRMDLAFSAATAVVSRAGAATVSEIQILEIPTIFVPYPVGNGEQEKNAADSLAAGAAVMVSDAEFTPERFLETVLPLLRDDAALERMRRSGKGLGRPDAAERFSQMMLEAAGERI
ncbi:MAG: hypothetical protein RL187_969 [Actinomycetota bacterium]|jgi:UDP-N-acetylglucosamine--N-acetylmuramyl-(pentapeptide) pyrophosphoryl-undecaprenol N-acetylglucosamine transferase